MHFNNLIMLHLSRALAPSKPQSLPFIDVAHLGLRTNLEQPTRMSDKIIGVNAERFGSHVAMTRIINQLVLLIVIGLTALTDLYHILIVLRGYLIQIVLA